MVWGGGGGGGGNYSKKIKKKLLSLLLLTLRANALEGCSSHFVYLSVCLSVSTDLEDGGLLALQRDMNLKHRTI